MIMADLLVPTIAGAVSGAVVGGLLAVWLLRRWRQPKQPLPDAPDPWVSAEIDRAAAAWATEQGRPEAAGLMADKLHLLHRLGLHRQGGHQ